MASAEVLNIIRTVRAGRRGIPQPIAAKLAEHTPRIPLTPREAEVLSLVAKRA
jgi:DNA-binding NarL/FixJ family response regulator